MKELRSQSDTDARAGCSLLSSQMFGAIAPEGSCRLRTETTAWVVRLGSLFSAVGIEAGGLKTWLSMVVSSLRSLPVKMLLNDDVGPIMFRYG